MLRPATADTRAASYTVLALVLTLATAPMLAVFVRGVPIFDIANEYVAYRIGDALNLMFGDIEYVRPVQGLPTALLSKAITNVLFVIYGRGIVEPAILQLYSAIFFVALFAIVALCVTWAWWKIGWMERLGIAFIATIPWYLKHTAFLLSAPEYWVGEYAFLVCSSAILARTAATGTPIGFWLGAWIGVGVAIKITLIGIAPIFAIALQSRGVRGLQFFTAGMVVSYLAVILAYAGFDPVLADKMLEFQFSFFADPNISYSYPNFGAALLANPDILILAGAVALLSLILMPREPRLALAAFLWAGLLTYLVAKRYHGTSIASATVCLIFLVGFLAARASDWRPVVVTAVLLCFTPTADYFPTRHHSAQGRSLTSEDLAGEILYMPDNYWNARTPLHAFAFNGGLGIRPSTEVDAAGRPISHTPALDALFGPVMLLGRSEYEISVMAKGLKAGMTIVWTRPEHDFQRSGVELFALLKNLGAVVSEREITYRGQRWYIGNAIAPKSSRHIW